MPGHCIIPTYTVKQHVPFIDTRYGVFFLDESLRYSYFWVPMLNLTELVTRMFIFSHPLAQEKSNSLLLRCGHAWFDCLDWLA